MRVDVERLQRFYASPLGEAAARMISRRVEAIWPHADGLDVLGLGWTPAYLKRLAPGARRAICAAPAAQGVAPCGAPGRNTAVLVDEERLPFPDAMFDRTLIAHALEEADSPTRMLRELWRVTAPEGRILVVVANRSGLWARAESTPFGHGRPYSRTQLNALLRDSMFQPTAWARALYAPPANWSFITQAAETWERTGEVGWASFGGVLMVEAIKRLYIDPKAEPERVDPVRAKAAATAQQAAAPQSRSPEAQNRLETARDRKLEPAD